MMQLFFQRSRNKKIRRFFLCGIVLLCSFSTTISKAQTKDTTYAPTDTANIYYNDSVVTNIVAPPTMLDSAVDVPTEKETDTAGSNDKKILASIVFLSEDSVNAIRRSKGFGYMAYIDSLLRSRQDAKNKKPQQKPQPVDTSESVSFWDFGIIKLLCWATAIGLIGFVLFKIFLGQGSAFASNTKNNIPEVNLDTELDEDDLEGQLKKAIQQSNYRLATRYLFLITLQQLSDKNAISLSTEKTNFQYTNELKGKPYAESFARLCFLYEYVWFGEFEINQDQFSSIQQEQQQLAKAI